MSVPIGPPKALLDALVSAGVIHADDLPRVARIRIDMPVGDPCKVTVDYVGGRGLERAMSEFIDGLKQASSHTERE